MAKRRPRPQQADTSSTTTAYSLSPLEVEVEEGVVPVSISWTKKIKDKVKEGSEVAKLLCRNEAKGGVEVVKPVLATKTGTLAEAVETSPPEAATTAAEGEGALNGGGKGGGGRVLQLGKVSYCTHPYLTGLICAVCGERGAEPERMTRVFVKGGHQLSVSKDEADVLHRSMSDRLWEARKLNLILDIDLTLLHATIDMRAEEMRSEEDAVHSFNVESQGRDLRHWCHLRPGLRQFLQDAQQLYVLSIYTHGRRHYAHQVAKLLDPDRSLFNDRIVSRDDCPDLQGQKSLQRLFPGGIEMALIVDDTPGVWQGEQQKHLLPVVPFHFYTDFSELNRIAGQPGASFRVIAGPHDDEQLQHTLRILRDVHELYYQDEKPTLPAGQRPKNVASCLATYRSRVFAGLSIIFSGLLPKNMDPRMSDIGYMAMALGAEVTEMLTERTTHIVAERTNTEKVVEGSKRPGVVVVSRLWLHLCFLHCERKDEKGYLLVVGPAPRAGKGERQEEGGGGGGAKRRRVADDGSGGDADGEDGGQGGGDQMQEGDREMEEGEEGSPSRSNGSHHHDKEDEEERPQQQQGDQEEDGRVAGSVGGGPRDGDEEESSLEDFAMDDEEDEVAAAGDDGHDDGDEEQEDS